MTSKKTHLIKPLLGSNMPTINHGNGIYLYDSTGKCYIDGSSGAITVNIGHGIKEVIDAMLEQANQISFVYRSQFTSTAAEKLAEILAAKAPGDLNSVFFVNSGSEATETALKVALQYWQELGMPLKNRIIARQTSYHGITLGALSMSGHKARRFRFEYLLEDYPVVTPPYCYRCPFAETYPECEMKCAKDLEEKIIEIGPEKIAGFIIEPVIGAAGGAIVPPKDYHQKVKEICDKYEILLIADEVMTGCGRTGKMFALDHWQVIPDIIALGKGLSSGYTPMAAIIISDKITTVVENGSKVIMSGHTYSANPQSAATCLAVLEYLEQNRLVENAITQGNHLEEGLKEMFRGSSIIGDIRGKGLLQGVEFVKDTGKKEPFQAEARVTERIVKECFESGLLIYPATGMVGGFKGDAVLIAPPLSITTYEMKLLLGIFEKAITTVTRQLIDEGIL